MRLFLTGCLAVLGLVLSVPTKAVETLQWEQKAIPLELVVGVEQLVQFQGSAIVGVPASLANPETFRHLFVNDTAYWKALEPFAKQRVKVRLESSGEFVLFDISARAEKRPPKSVEPISIIAILIAQGDLKHSLTNLLMTAVNHSIRPTTILQTARQRLRQAQTLIHLTKKNNPRIRGDLRSLELHEQG